MVQYKNMNMLKEQSLSLRRRGKTYSEIRRIVDKHLPKSTLSYWCKNIILSRRQQEKVGKNIKNNLERARAAALITNKIKRKKYLESVRSRVKHLKEVIKNKDVAKISLAMLYLGEGSKTNKGFLTFGNSSPEIVGLFLNFLRCCYNIDEHKFRCTLQCRADQNIKKLEKFWSRMTRIPLSQFYKARVDPRTINKPSKNLNYKGVCRIDYFSADLFNELIKIIEVIS